MGVGMGLSEGMEIITSPHFKNLPTTLLVHSLTHSLTHSPTHGESQERVPAFEGYSRARARAPPRPAMTS